MMTSSEASQHPSNAGGVRDTEQWAAISFHPGYEVSTHGRMRNTSKFPPNIIASHVNPSSGLHSKTFPGGRAWVVARLVLTVFVRPAAEGEQAIYLDKDRSNLRLSNLRWSSTGNPNRKSTAAQASNKGWTFIDPDARVRNLGDIIDCDGGKIYSDGRIQTPSGKQRQANEHHYDPRGYQRVSIVTTGQQDEKRNTGKECKGKAFDIHRLVAKAFLPAPGFDNAQVDHINGKKWDNRAENLQWVTNKENNKRAHARGNTGPHQKKVRLYKFDAESGEYVFKREYDNMTVAGKSNGFKGCGAVHKGCNKKKEELASARKHAKSAFLKTHVFRFSETDDLV